MSVSASAADLDLEALQRELFETENYLVHSRSHGLSDSISSQQKSDSGAVTTNAVNSSISGGLRSSASIAEMRRSLSNSLASSVVLRSTSDFTTLPLTQDKVGPTSQNYSTGQDSTPSAATTEYKESSIEEPKHIAVAETPTVQPTQSQRYNTPEEREAMIQRLLAEHNSRKMNRSARESPEAKTPNISLSSSQYNVSPTPQNFYATSPPMSTPSKNYDSSPESGSSQTDSPLSDTLFFASDVHQSTPLPARDFDSAHIEESTSATDNKYSVTSRHSEDNILARYGASETLTQDPLLETTRFVRPLHAWEMPEQTNDSPTEVDSLAHTPGSATQRSRYYSSEDAPDIDSHSISSPNYDDNEDLVFHYMNTSLMPGDDDKVLSLIPGHHEYLQKQNTSHYSMDPRKKSIPPRVSTAGIKKEKPSVVASVQRRGRSKFPSRLANAALDPTVSSALRVRSKSIGKENRPNFVAGSVVSDEKLPGGTAAAAVTTSGTPREVRTRLRSKEELLAEAEAQFKSQCTFHPKLYTRSGDQSTTNGDQSGTTARDGESSKISSSRVSQHIEELYHYEKQRQANRVAAASVVEELQKMECTFHPKLSKSTLRLLKEKELEQRQMQAHYGYGHQTASSITQSSSPVNVDEVSMRLYKEAESRAKDLTTKARLLEAEQLADCTFHPVRKTVSKDDRFGLDDHVPIHERVVDLQREKQRYLSQLRQNHEAESNAAFTFHPTIDEKSKVLAEKRIAEEARTADGWVVFDHGTDVGSRLLNEARKMARRKQNALCEYEHELAAASEPVGLSKGTKAITQRSELLQADFSTRQRAFDERVAENRERQMQQINSEASKWFSPSIAPLSSNILDKVNPTRQFESIVERCHRLSQLDYEAKEEERRRIEQQVYGKFNFQPDLDPVSKAFGRPSSVQELYENPRGKTALAAAKAKAERRESEECTFSPQINENSRKLAEGDVYEQFYKQYTSGLPSEAKSSAGVTAGVHSVNGTVPVSSVTETSSSRLGRINMSEPDRMQREIRIQALRREEKRRNELIARELSELQECTFSPTLYSSDPYMVRAANKPVVVKGLARHLELQELSRKQKEDLEVREYAAFHVVNPDRFRSPEDGSTIVTPFTFNLDSRLGEHSVVQAK